MSNVNHEGFEYIEMHPEGISVSQFAEKFGIKESSAANWLSKWSSKGFIHYSNGPRGLALHQRGRTYGLYSITESCRWWGDLVYEGNRENG